MIGPLMIISVNLHVFYVLYSSKEKFFILTLKLLKKNTKYLYWVINFRFLNYNLILLQINYLKHIQSKFTIMQKYSKITIMKNLNNEIKLHYFLSLSVHMPFPNDYFEHNYTRDRVCSMNKYSTAEEKEKMVLTW